MLAVAPSAVDAITMLVTANGLPDSAGVRLAPTPTADLAATPSADPQQPQLQIALSQAPGPDDQVIDAGDAHVFVDALLSGMLDDYTLEATSNDQRIHFTLISHAA